MEGRETFHGLIKLPIILQLQDNNAKLLSALEKELEHFV